MLARWVFTVWGAWLGALGLAAALTASAIWNPNPILPVGLSVLMFAAGLGLVIAVAVRLIRGPRRDRALAGLLVGTAPFWFLAGHILLAMRPAFNLHVPPGWPSKVFSPLARSLVDLEARWFYPERTSGKWVTMVGATAKDVGPWWPRWTGTLKPRWPGSTNPRPGRSSGIVGRSLAWGRAPFTTWRSGPKSANTTTKVRAEPTA
jgi:hypothetical protein